MVKYEHHVIKFDTTEGDLDTEPGILMEIIQLRKGTNASHISLHGDKSTDTVKKPIFNFYNSIEDAHNINYSYDRLRWTGDWGSNPSLANSSKYLLVTYKPGIET